MKEQERSLTGGTAIIILAGGSSSRLGRPKQLLPFRGDTLIGRAAAAALQAATAKVVVVVGAQALQVQNALDGKDVMIVQNEDWEEGMSSSIKRGMESIHDTGIWPASVLLCVCDQPYISSQLFVQMMAAKEETGKGIIACSYAGTIGVPVLFDSRYFYTLQNLQASEGAKNLLFRFKGDVATLPFAEGAIDIDTEEDYRQLREG